MNAALTQTLGRTVRYNEVTPKAYRAFDFLGAEDLGNMFQFKRDLGTSRALNPDLQTFDQWLARNRSCISIEESKSSVAT
jgi:hypothetical protein